MSLATNIQNLATRIGTEVKAVRTLVNGNTADLSALTTTQKSNLVSALNSLKAEVDAAAQSGGAAINDGVTSTSSVWSSQKTSDSITAAISALTAGAPGALDTLDELAAALGDDANFASTVTTALSNRVRYDAAQTLTTPQQVQARANIGAASAADVGDTSTNYVTTFESALA